MNHAPPLARVATRCILPTPKGRRGLNLLEFGPIAAMVRWHAFPTGVQIAIKMNAKALPQPEGWFTLPTLWLENL